jgi:hypothetical protein
VDAEEGLEPEPYLHTEPFEVLIAALIAKDYLPSINDTKAKINKHRELALDWLDWAVCESDMGRALAEAKAQAALNFKKGDGNITVQKP